MSIMSAAFRLAKASDALGSSAANRAKGARPGLADPEAIHDHEDFFPDVNNSSYKCTKSSR